MELKNSDGVTEKEFLERYNPNDYQRLSATVDMLILGMSKNLDSLKLLLTKRQNHPFIGQWSLVGGFIPIDKSGYETACDVIRGKTGLNNLYVEQLYSMTRVDRDPRMRVIDITYLALTSNTDIDVLNSLWFDVSLKDNYLTLTNEDNDIVIRYKMKKKVYTNGSVKTTGYYPILDGDLPLAFDHAEVIYEGLMRLRGKFEYSDLAFGFVKNEFTLSDLQRIYEIVLDKKLYKSNFKNSLVGKIESLDRKGVSIVGHKKSELYRYTG